MRHRFELLILGISPDSFLEKISEVKEWAEIHVARDLAEARNRIPQAEAIVVLGHSGSWLRECWHAAGRLRWIHSASTGVEDILFPELVEKPILLTNSRGAYSSPLAEFVMLCILFFAKSVPLMERNRRNHLWEAYPLEELRGQTIGIVGFGETGRAVSRLANAFGMKVLATKRDSKVVSFPSDIAHAIPLERWWELLSASDYIVNALPLTGETRHKFDERAFRAMKSPSYFVNVGRGKTVDEVSLLRALKAGWIAGAGLDVFETEPLDPDSELYSLPNVILSPHCADRVPSSTNNVVTALLENVRRFARGEALLNIVDKQQGY